MELHLKETVEDMLDKLLIIEDQYKEKIASASETCARQVLQEPLPCAQWNTRVG
jgi:hypothetical protein